MSIHRARLVTRDFIADDGTVVPMIKDAVPIGAEYFIDTSVRSGRRRIYNSESQRTFEVNMVWVTSASFNGAGFLAAQVLDIDEGIFTGL